MSWNARRNQIVAAVDSTVQVFNMRDPGELHFILYMSIFCICFLGALTGLLVAIVLHVPESSFLV